MKLDQYLDRILDAEAVRSNKERDGNHVRSGRLSAGRLGDPLQWQILASLGVPSRPFDPETLGKFQRGRDVEDWLVGQLSTLCAPALVGTQMPLTYRGVGGLADLVMQTLEWDFPSGTIPVECKSVTREKFVRIQRQGGDQGHKLQAGLYGLALKSKAFALAYVNTNDYRRRVELHDTERFREEIDGIIDRYDAAMAKLLADGTVPVFVPMMKWQAEPRYCKYPDWATLSQEECNEKIKPFLKP